MHTWRSLATHGAFGTMVKQAMSWSYKFGITPALCCSAKHQQKQFIFSVQMLSWKYVCVRTHNAMLSLNKEKWRGRCNNNVPTCRANVCAKPLQGKDWQRMKVCWLIWVFMGFQGSCHVHVVSKTLIMHLFLLYYTQFFSTVAKWEAEILIRAF